MWFYDVFRFSMHPARWLILFAHVANSEAQLRFPRPRSVKISCVFSNENGISEGRRFVAHAREAMPTISLFPVSPTFSRAKVWVQKGNGEARDLGVSSFTLFPRAKRQKG